MLLPCGLTIDAVEFIVAQDQGHQLGLAEDAKVWHLGQEVISQIEVLQFCKGLFREKSSTRSAGTLAQSLTLDSREGTRPYRSLHPTNVT